MRFGSAVREGTALVVGASGGIGQAFTERLLDDERFARVIATHRDPAAGDALRALAPAGDRLDTLPLDVTDEGSIRGALEQVREATPTLDLVLYCVGLLHDERMGPEKRLRDVERDKLLRSFEVNAIGAALIAKHVLPLLSHERPNVLACISAKVGSIEDNRLGGWYGYRASKAALNMLMRTAAIEYRRASPASIVALLHPGTTDTELSRPFQRGVPEHKLFAPSRTVDQLMTVIDGLEPGDAGAFLSWDGSRLPW